MSAGPVASKCNELVKGRISRIPCERPIIQFCNTTHRSNSNSGESDRDALNLTIITYYRPVLNYESSSFDIDLLTLLPLHDIYIRVVHMFRNIIFHNLKRQKKEKNERQRMKHGVIAKNDTIFGVDTEF